MSWQVQEAKQRFSEVLRAAETGEPQIVTRHGDAVAAIIDIATYRSLRAPETGFVDFLLSDPVLDDDEAQELFSRSEDTLTDRTGFSE